MSLKKALIKCINNALPKIEAVRNGKLKNSCMNRKHYSLKNLNHNQTIDCIPQIRTQIPLFQIFSPKSNIVHISQNCINNIKQNNLKHTCLV